MFYHGDFASLGTMYDASLRLSDRNLLMGTDLTTPQM